jgi:hypothetical protein
MDQIEKQLKKIIKGMASSHKHKWRYSKSCGESYCTVCGKWRHQIEGY